MYNIYIDTNNNVDCIEACDSCLSNHECLPTCSISEYWLQGSYSNCSACNSECEFGCRDNRTTCTLCEDLLCHVCPDLVNCEECAPGASLGYNETECRCLENYTSSGDSCNICDRGYVQDNICVPCVSKCIECSNAGCIKCVPNADLYSQVCYCQQGYFGTSECNFVLFYVNVTVSRLNIIYLDFSDSLKTTFQENDILLAIDQSNISFTLSQFTDTRYAIYVEFNENIQNGTQLLISLSGLVSCKNGILNNTEFILELNEFIVTADYPVKEASTKISQTVVSVATYAAASLSMINPNPAALWSFVNTIQMIVYIYLAQIELSQRFAGYLLGLKKYQPFPNIFDYIASYQGETHQFTRAQDLGFHRNSIFVNIGSWVSCFLCFVCLYYVIYLCYLLVRMTRYKDSKVAEFLIGKCRGYKYAFFLRFWIQAYLDMSVACLITYYSSDLTSLGQAYNLYFSIIFGVIFIQIIVGLTPIIIFLVGLKKSKEKTENTQSTLNLWASLFYEFKEDSGAAQSQFYTIFFIRRLAFVTILFTLQEYPVLQLCLSEILILFVFSMQMMFFILYSKPFAENALYYANLISEIGLSVIILLVGFFLFNISEAKKNQLDLLLMVIVNIILSSQMSASLFITARNIAAKWKNRKNKIAIENDRTGKREIEILVSIVPEEVEINDDAVVSFANNKINLSPASSVYPDPSYNEVDFKFFYGSSLKNE